MSSNEIEVGSIVEPINSNHTLASGCSRYENAIVVQLDPFILVSEAADMRWGCTVAAQNFKAVGKASDEVLKLCMGRL